MHVCTYLSLLTSMPTATYLCIIWHVHLHMHVFARLHTPLIQTRTL